NRGGDSARSQHRHYPYWYEGPLSTRRPGRRVPLRVEAVYRLRSVEADYPFEVSRLSIRAPTALSTIRRSLRVRDQNCRGSIEGNGQACSAAAPAAGDGAMPPVPRLSQ